MSAPKTPVPDVLAPETPALYVYGFGLHSPSVWPVGIAGPVQWVAGEGIGAIAEAGVDLARLQTHEEALLQAVLTHDQVLQAIFAQGPVLPLRFGTLFPHHTALAQYLAKASDCHRRQLLALGDRAEYGITLTPAPPEPEPPLPTPTTTTGRAYFLAKKARLQAQAEHQQQQQLQSSQTLATLAAQFPLVMGPGEAPSLRCFVLAARSGHTLDQALTMLQSQAPLWRLHRSPPLPPYHFPEIPLSTELNPEATTGQQQRSP